MLKLFQFDDLPRDKEFYDKLKPMESLKSIKAFVPAHYGPHCRLSLSDIVAKGILGSCPNLEIFDFEFDDFPFLSINN